MPVSDRIASLAVSQTLAMSQKSSELKAQGIDVINMSVGEPDFFTPDAVKHAAKQAIDANFSFYSPVPGYPALREAICQKLLAENNLSYKPSQIVCSNGAKQCVCNAVLALVNPGDEVIVPAPYWVSYVEMVKLAEGRNVIIEAGIENDFKITPEQLEAAITDRTRALILCSPSNPTGSVYSREELAALAAVLERHPDVFVIADEIYEHINYVGAHASMASFEALRDRVVIINGVSKAYAMTGWRIGWMAAPEWLAKACTKLQGQYTSGPNSVAQQAALAAYTGSQQCVADMRDAFRRRRDLIVSLMREIPGLEVREPQGAFYLFPKCSAYIGKQYDGEVIDGREVAARRINDVMDLAMYLLEAGHVATVGGAAFGSSECIRLSYATSDANIIEAARRIKAALSKLR